MKRLLSVIITVLVLSFPASTTIANFLLDHPAIQTDVDASINNGSALIVPTQVQPRVDPKYTEKGSVEEMMQEYPYEQS